MSLQFHIFPCPKSLCTPYFAAEKPAKQAGRRDTLRIHSCYAPTRSSGLSRNTSVFVIVTGKTRIAGPISARAKHQLGSPLGGCGSGRMRR